MKDLRPQILTILHAKHGQNRYSAGTVCTVTEVRRVDGIRYGKDFFYFGKELDWEGYHI